MKEIARLGAECGASESGLCRFGASVSSRFD